MNKKKAILVVVMIMFAVFSAYPCQQLEEPVAQENRKKTKKILPPKPCPLPLSGPFVVIQINNVNNLEEGGSTAKPHACEKKRDNNDSNVLISSVTMRSCFFKYLVPLLTLLVAIIACIIACLIPKRVMNNQMLANLLAEYRTPKMGQAILALCDFHKKHMKGKSAKEIKDAYKEKYEKQIGKYLNAPDTDEADDTKDFSSTLHFQRRQVAQFFYSMGKLMQECYCIRPRDKYLKDWFTDKELQLMRIIFHLDEPAKDVFIPLDVDKFEGKTDADMYTPIHYLYYKVEKMLEKKKKSKMLFFQKENPTEQIIVGSPNRRSN